MLSPSWNIRTDVCKACQRQANDSFCSSFDVKLVHGNRRAFHKDNYAIAADQKAISKLREIMDAFKQVNIVTKVVKELNRSATVTILHEELHTETPIVGELHTVTFVVS